jgi:acetylornithine/succinyldiaminopimelate/putrescine aminotransferase
MSDFLKYQAQTTPHPLGMEVSHARGSYIYDTAGKAYLDFVAGVSACSLGHGHPRVVAAIKTQLDSYLHVMVYGEYAQTPAVSFCKLLAQKLPDSLSKTYLTNSGTEAIEGALKLAKRATGRSKTIAFHHAYHGNTQGAMSVMGFEERKAAFRPLIPDVHFIRFNEMSDLDLIDRQTACVIAETIQGGAGFIVPNFDYMKKLRQKCTETGALLILDEIQPGFGRTGKLFGFEHFDIVPDILVMGKGMGGGMPVGAFTATDSLMDLLSDAPTLGHITTFGGHPVIAAACLATLQELTETTIIADTLAKEAQCRSLLKHPLIKEIRGKGLMLALMMETPEMANQLVLTAHKRGLILFWLLYEKRAVRITPPLTISSAEIEIGCRMILDILDEMSSKL